MMNQVSSFRVSNRRPVLRSVNSENVTPVTGVETMPPTDSDFAEVVQTNRISTRPWDLTKPQYGEENYFRYRAQSILTGMEFQDGSKHAPILPVEQALDIVNWNWDTGRTL